MPRPHGFILFFELYVVIACLTLTSESYGRVSQCGGMTAACVLSIGKGALWSAVWPASWAWVVYNHKDPVLYDYGNPEADIRNVVSNSAGTPIGNLTDYGGLAASFDNNLTKVATACSAPPGGMEVPAPHGYNNFIGKDWGSGVRKKITGFRLFPPIDQAMMQTTAMDLKLQGSNDNVTWTDLYVGVGVAPGMPANLTVTSRIDSSTAYRFHRINIQGNGVNALTVCQVQFGE